ncbi:MAG: hypothetical protein JW973_11025 [Bacteroidales bacterium]|nr:hypothetical protein [Bacteroidales bacterium]MBN2699545.1 hypothetical protein [Bacteroidales bacterium]
MKKIFLGLMITGLSLTFIPLQLNATPKVTPSSVVDPIPVSPAEAARANELLLRLNEINTSDKSNLNSSEKKLLRKEVSSINSELKAIGNGVYISGAALIIIIILLIILL